jgi:glyoxylase-like metal-dependent hydrolase (beta-lactamase superfamily II)
MSEGSIGLDVYTCPARDLPNGGQFSPTTATLLTGATEAVLVDTQYMPADVEELARRIDASGRVLAAIYITHAHADHYFGIDWLAARFPGARVLALPSVVAAIESGHEAARAQWLEFFGGEALDPSMLPTSMNGTTLTLDGHEVHAIEVGQGDVAPSTVLHIPSIDAVVAGDVVYNGVHPFLAASGPEEWPCWIESIEKIAALHPRVVVAGHKREELGDDDIDGVVQGTARYLSDFIRELEQCDGARELVSRMSERYPEHANPSALLLSAVTAVNRKRAESSQDDLP